MIRQFILITRNLDRYHDPTSSRNEDDVCDRELSGYCFPAEVLANISVGGTQFFDWNFLYSILSRRNDEALYLAAGAKVSDHRQTQVRGHLRALDPAHPTRHYRTLALPGEREIRNTVGVSVYYGPNRKVLSEGAYHGTARRRRDRSTGPKAWFPLPQLD